MTASADLTEIREVEDPFALFQTWMAEAEASEPNDANAMAVATAGHDGMPSVRMILLKGIDDRGFVFYTNTESPKGRQLAENAKAGLCFHWKSLRRQVRARGPVEPVSEAEADAYFATRPRGSQIGAWASLQSTTLPSRTALEERIEAFERDYAGGDVPRPPHWSGYRVIPDVIEFWLDRTFRLHDRLIYRRDGDAWVTERVYP